MTKPLFSFGEEVLIPWGVSEVRATVREIYGPPGNEHVVVDLTPAISGFIVDEPTTVSLTLDALKKVAPAA